MYRYRYVYRRHTPECYEYKYTYYVVGLPELLHVLLHPPTDGEVEKAVTLYRRSRSRSTGCRYEEK